MLGDNLRNLEYAKGARHFEDEIHPFATYEDLDEELISAYKVRIGASDMDAKQVLTARGFIQKKDGEECITNAAVFLFAKNILKFNMNCRLRFIRVDGREMLVGDRNIRNFHGLRVSLMPWHIVTGRPRDSIFWSACMMTDWKSRVPDGCQT